MANARLCTSVTLNTPEGPRQMINDRVIVQIGGQPPSARLRTIGIELVEKRGRSLIGSRARLHMKCAPAHEARACA